MCSLLMLYIVLVIVFFGDCVCFFCNVKRWSIWRCLMIFGRVTCLQSPD